MTMTRWSGAGGSTSALFENEGLSKSLRGEARFLPSGDDNHVGALDGLFLQKLSHRALIR